MRRPLIILGAPGTGKTTRCLLEVERALAAGVAPQRIAYVSFTRAAVEEARDRAAKKFGLPPKAFKYFRTLHSLALHLLGASPSELLRKEHYADLTELIGEKITGATIGIAIDGEPRSMRAGSMGLFLDQLARLTRRPVRGLYDALPMEDRPPWLAVDRAVRIYTHYRSDEAVMDFTDLLEQAVAEAFPLNLDLAIVDEAQDLSRLQWALVRNVLTQTKKLIIAGDDDQAIYKWAGADVKTFLTLIGEEEHLPISHRLPRAVHRVGVQLVSRLSARRNKQFAPRDAEGKVIYHRHFDGVPIDPAAGSWLLLARHRSQVAMMEQELRLQARPFICHDGTSSVDPQHLLAIQAWERWRKGREATREMAEAFGLTLEDNVDHIPAPSAYPKAQLIRPWWEVLKFGKATVEYYRGILRRGRSLFDPPTLRVDTIHGVKGAQADNVLLHTRLNRRTDWTLHTQPDDEHRVFYVGATRAKQALHIIEDGARYAYPFHM